MRRPVARASRVVAPIAPAVELLSTDIVGAGIGSGCSPAATGGLPWRRWRGRTRRWCVPPARSSTPPCPGQRGDDVESSTRRRVRRNGPHPGRVLSVVGHPDPHLVVGCVRETRKGDRACRSLLEASSDTMRTRDASSSLVSPSRWAWAKERASETEAGSGRTRVGSRFHGDDAAEARHLDDAADDR